jgi:hypothetical protein
MHLALALLLINFVMEETCVLVRAVVSVVLDAFPDGAII